MNERVHAFSRAKEMAAELFQVIEPYPSQHKAVYSQLPTLLEDKKRDELQGRNAFISLVWQAADLPHARLNELIEQIDVTICRSN